MLRFRRVSGLCFCVSSFCCFIAFSAPTVDLEFWLGFRSSNGVLGVILGALICIGFEGIGRFRSFDGVLVLGEAKVYYFGVFLGALFRRGEGFGFVLDPEVSGIWLNFTASVLTLSYLSIGSIKFQLKELLFGF
ncbi:hypothetical protein QL285_087707 [Trifolium repens]|nr:hypothetical protein QL285_087707 [Trifolium repens]